MEGKSMKRAERRHRSRMARKRRYRLVEDLCGVNLREVPTKVARRDFIVGPSTVPRHQWIAMSFNSERKYAEIFGGSLQDRQAVKAGAVRERRACSGKPDPKHFNLITETFRARVGATLRAQVPETCVCDEYHTCGRSPGPCHWCRGRYACAQCLEFDWDRNCLKEWFRDLDLEDSEKVSEFLVALRRYVQRYLG